VEARIRKSYDYAFQSTGELHRGAVPQLEFRSIGLEPFEVLGGPVTPVRLKHGKRFDVLGFRIGNVAYCTDANSIPPESMERLRGLDVLVLDALRPSGHATHFSLEEAIQVSHELAPRQTYFTHMSHELEQEATNAKLPPSMALAYDGMRIALT
jgi:phosphoribosyl 1,2-cyclic phosphate phosphodiesterase